MSALDSQRLIRLARESIETYFSGKVPKSQDFYDDKLGAFVTLHMNGELRGCIGYPEPIMELDKAIVNLARAAAFEDPRFPPLQEAELKDIDIEISVLTKPELLDIAPEEYPDKIRIGTDGLIIRGIASGLLLPQVAAEQGWNAVQFLEHVCLKAGMTTDAWKDTKNHIYIFQAQIFRE